MNTTAKHNDLLQLFSHNESTGLKKASPGHTLGNTYDLKKDGGHTIVEHVSDALFTVLVWAGTYFMVVDEANNLEEALQKAVDVSGN